MTVVADHGVVALLFTDLVGSTELLARLGDDAAEELRHRHFALLRQAVADSGGAEVKTLGDGVMVSFPSCLGAVACAVAMQRAVAAHNESDPDGRIAIRVGVDAGEPFQDEDDFFGTSVTVAKRLCDKAEGGQILVSEVVAALVGSRGGFLFRPAGRLRLKGLPQPLAAVFVDWDGLRAAPPTATSPPARRAPRGPRLVGREREMAVLHEALGRAASGQFACVLLEGDAGVGKTRLADEVVCAATGLALAARAYPLGEGAAFGVWAEALERCFRDMAPAVIDRLCGGFLDDLAGLLRSVAAARGSVPEREPSRLRLVDGLTVALANLAAEADGPLVVNLDDVHWADASSWEVLAHIGRHLQDRPILVLAAARPVELAEHPVAGKVLLALDRDGLLARLSVAPLAREAIGSLAEVVLGDSAPSALVEWLDDRARGNPLFALGLLRALQEEGADLAAPQLRRLPEGLAGQVRQRLETLDEPARSTLETLATLGRRVDFGEVVRLTGRPLDRLAPILDGLVKARLLTDEERGAELIYEVAHPLVTEAIYQEIGTARRRALHRLVARALLAGGRLAEAAPHFARSAEVGDPEAIEALVDALRQAEGRGAYREALSVLGSLVDLLPAGDKRWLQVAEAMSFEAEWVVDHRADLYAGLAIKALRAIEAAMGPDADPARQATIHFRLASFLGWGTGDLDEARAACRQAIACFEAVGDQRRVMLGELELGWLDYLSADPPDAHFVAGSRVARRAEQAGDRFVAMQALGRSVGFGGLWLGRLAEAETASDRTLVLLREERRGYFQVVAEALRATTLGLQGRIIEARASIEHAKALPEWRETVLLECQAITTWLAGDLEATRAAAEESLVWNAGRLSRRRALSFPCMVVAVVEADRLDDAHRYLDLTLAAFDGRPWGPGLALCQWAGAIIAWRETGPGAAIDGLRAAADDLEAKRALAFAAFVLTDLAEAAATSDRADIAQDAAGRLATAAEGIGYDLYRGLAAVSRAWVDLAAGRSAADAAARAVELLGATGCLLFHGRALDTLGRALPRSERALALRTWEEAARIFEACGARWRLDRTLGALASLGNPGKRAAAAVTGPASLTSRERQATRLAAQGLTARQIGERLFIGERTVESHLARAYAKLGIRSKAELVERASEFDL
jgi:class 3 adenylate cyclase/DNA-binding CsgD family transcriptional regulator